MTRWLTTFVEAQLVSCPTLGQQQTHSAVEECVWIRVWEVLVTVYIYYFVCVCMCVYMQHYRGVKAVSISEMRCICVFVQVLYSVWPLFCSSAAAWLNLLSVPIWSSDRWELLEVPFTHSSLHSSTPQVSVTTQGYGYKADLSATFLLTGLFN